MFSTIVYPIAAALALLAPVVSLVLFAVVPMFFIGTLLAVRETAASPPE